MKVVNLILVGSVVLFRPELAWGVANAVGVYPEPSGVSCSFFDDTPGPVSYHVVHINFTGGRSGISFWAPLPACMIGATYVSDTPVFQNTTGDSQAGVSIDYGQCLNASVHVLTINLIVQATTSNCCCFYVYRTPPLMPGGIETIDCAANIVLATPWAGLINPTPSCQCNLDGSPNFCANAPVPVEETTWGRVKALYQD